MIGLICSLFNGGNYKISTLHFGCVGLNEYGRIEHSAGDISQRLGGLLCFFEGKRINCTCFIVDANYDSPPFVITQGAHLAGNVVVIYNPLFELDLAHFGQISQFQYFFFGHSLQVFTKIKKNWLPLQQIVEFGHGLGLDGVHNVDVRLHGLVVGVAGPFHDNVGRNAHG